MNDDETLHARPVATIEEIRVEVESLRAKNARLKERLHRSYGWLRFTRSLFEWSTFGRSLLRTQRFTNSLAMRLRNRQWGRFKREAFEDGPFVLQDLVFNYTRYQVRRSLFSVLVASFAGVLGTLVLVWQGIIFLRQAEEMSLQRQELVLQREAINNIEIAAATDAFTMNLVAAPLAGPQVRNEGSAWQIRSFETNRPGDDSLSVGLRNQLIDAVDLRLFNFSNNYVADVSVAWISRRAASSWSSALLSPTRRINEMPPNEQTRFSGHYPVDLPMQLAGDLLAELRSFCKQLSDPRIDLSAVLSDTNERLRHGPADQRLVVSAYAPDGRLHEFRYVIRYSISVTDDTARPDGSSALGDDRTAAFEIDVNAIRVSHDAHVVGTY